MSDTLKVVTLLGSLRKGSFNGASGHGYLRAAVDR